MFEKPLVDIMAFEISRSGSNDIVLLFQNEASWLSQAPVLENKNDQFEYVWTNTKGIAFGYKEYPIGLKESHSWTSFYVTVIFK